MNECKPLFDGSEAGAEEQAATEGGANGRAGDGVVKGKGEPAAGGSAAPAAASSHSDINNDSADPASAGVKAPSTSASDLTAKLFGEGGVVSSDAQYRRVYNSAGGRIGPPRAEVDRAHLAGDVR